MSAIAKFYVVSSNRLTDIIDAAKPVSGGWFRAARDNFSSVLKDAARELEAFAWSGWVFNTLDLYLEDRHGLSYPEFGDAAMSRQLSKARGSDWLVMPAASAARLLAALETIDCEANDVTAFVATERGSDLAEEEVAGVGAAFAALKSWLAEIAPGSVGLLSIG